MNVFQICSNTSDLVPLYLPLELYLKPIARLSISLRIPKSKKVGKSISYWEIMDKIRDLIKPEEFTSLKVTRTTIEYVIFEGEIEAKAKLEMVISRLDNRMIKLKDFADLMRIRVGTWKSDFPTQQIWDDFFQNAKEMNEMKPGERPDTIHIANLPTKWFMLNTSKTNLPSEKLLYKIFEKFGSIRVVDIPLCDPFRNKMNEQISGIKNCSLETTDFFEAYVQFKDYVGFKMTMNALYNMKLVHKEVHIAEEINIKVDFDKSKHLSDASINRRKIVRERLILRARKKEEKERTELEETMEKEAVEKQKQLDIKEQKQLRRKLREEKRKAKILQKLQIGSTTEINSKIAKEEKKLLRVQRKLEAIRLVEELYKRIKEKHIESAVKLADNNEDSADEIRKLRSTSELEVRSQKEKLNHAMEGREMLKTILLKNKSMENDSSSSDTELSLDEPVEKVVRPIVLEKYPELLYDPHWLRFPYQVPSGFAGNMYPDYRGGFRFGQRRKPFGRYLTGPGTSRDTNYGRRRGNFNRQWNYNRNYNESAIPLVDLEKACRKYFSKLIDKDDNVSSRSRSRTRRRSSRRSYSSSRSPSHSRSRRSSSYSDRSSRVKSRDRSYRSSSRSRKKFHDKSRSRSRSRSKSKSRYRSKSKEHHSYNDENSKKYKSSDYKKKDREESVGRTPSPKQLQNSSEVRSRSKSTSSRREKDRGTEQ